MRWLFIACASVIAVVYYAAISQNVKAIDQGMSSLLFAFRDAPGMTVDSTIEPSESPQEWRDYPSGNVYVTEDADEDEETPYYFPPGQPKEEKDMVYPT